MPIAVFDLVAIIAAVGLAAIGGEAFFKAIIALAKRLQVLNALVAMTIAAFATSTPELTVSTMAALSGQPEIGLGDALGSNVVNIALIFGIALWFGPIRPSNEDFRGDFKLALLVPLLTLVLALDGRLSRADGLILLLLFSTWLGLIVRATLQRRHEHFEPHSSPASSMLTTLGLGALGLGALMAAGRLFVMGATGIAATLGIDTYVIGALVVAIGTSLPELVTVILSRLRGHDDIGVGTLIGSNLFNGLAIVGLAATLHPIALPLQEIAVTLVCGIAALLRLPPNRSGVIPRQRCLLLFGIYGIFIWATLAAGRYLPN